MANIEYDEYVRVYRTLVDKRLRPEECMATDGEWAVLSPIAKEDIIERLKKEIDGIIHD